MTVARGIIARLGNKKNTVIVKLELGCLVTQELFQLPDLCTRSYLDGNCMLIKSKQQNLLARDGICFFGKMSVKLRRYSEKHPASLRK